MTWSGSRQELVFREDTVSVFQGQFFNLFGGFYCRMLDDFSHEMDNTQSRLDNVMKKLAKVSHMTSGNLPSNT